jgi:glutamyl-Q tRNA(Asp) synthetase
MPRYFFRHPKARTTTKTSHTTRFAPSPTGHLHLGHAFAALFARQAGARFLLRFEDIDPSRCHAEFEDAMREDLAWLGLVWEAPVRRQSEHLDDYRAALARLEAGNFLYPCFCTRKEIEREIANIGNAPHGPEGPLYPGTCRALSPTERAERLASGIGAALRLDIARALAATGPLFWEDREKGRAPAEPARLGDVVLARKDIATSYHLAVTVEVAPHEWHHHRQITDAEGQRLAKRDQSITLRALRDGGRTAASIRAELGFE